MIEAQPIGLTNTLVPLAALGTAAALFPWLLVPRNSRSQRDIAVTIWACSAIMLILSAGVFALVYAAWGIGVAQAFADAPMATVRFFLGRGGVAALVWGPVLALVWLALAQRVERLKSEDGMRNG